MTSPSTNTSSSESAVALLDKLTSPTPSLLARKQLRINPPPAGKRRGYARGNSDPKLVTPSQCTKEYPGEELIISGGHLFCNACREELSLKASVVRSHVKSEKHVKGKKQLASKEARERDIATTLQQHNTHNHLEGESLLIDQQVYRVKVLTPEFENYTASC